MYTKVENGVRIEITKQEHDAILASVVAPVRVTPPLDPALKAVVDAVLDEIDVVRQRNGMNAVDRSKFEGALSAKTGRAK